MHEKIDNTFLVMTQSVSKRKIKPNKKVVVKKKTAPKKSVKIVVKTQPKKNVVKTQPKKNVVKAQPKKKVVKAQLKKVVKAQPKKVVKVQPKKKVVKAQPKKVVKAQPKKKIVEKVQPKKAAGNIAAKPVEKVESKPVAKPVENKTAKVPVKQDIAKRTTIKIRPTSVDKQQASPVLMTTERPKNVGVPASISQKKRLVVSYQNMNPELEEAFREKYPKGYADYMADLFKVDKPDGTSFYAISMETHDAVYLIKMIVKVDDYDDAQNGLFPDAAGAESDGPAEGETFPDNDTENMGDADDDADADE